MTTASPAPISTTNGTALPLSGRRRDARRHREIAGQQHLAHAHASVTRIARRGRRPAPRAGLGRPPHAPSRGPRPPSTARVLLSARPAPSTSAASTSRGRVRRAVPPAPAPDHEERHRNQPEHDHRELERADHPRRGRIPREQDRELEQREQQQQRIGDVAGEVNERLELEGEECAPASSLGRTLRAVWIDPRVQRRCCASSAATSAGSSASATTRGSNTKRQPASCAR